MFQRILSVIFTCLITLSVSASHNLAGSMSAERDPADPSGLTYIITLATYTDPSAQNVDRCSADIEIWNAFGQLEATLKDIPRANGAVSVVRPQGCSLPANITTRDGVQLVGTIKQNFYIVKYTFKSVGTFELRYSDFARIDGLINLPNGGQEYFFVNTFLFIPPASWAIGGGSAANSSPNFLNTPLDFIACIGKIWTHNPGGFDSDGDSLSYALAVCQRYNPDTKISPSNIVNYKYPDDVNGEIPNSFTMNPVTGLMTWNTPAKNIGPFVVAYIVTEWRRRYNFATGKVEVFKLGSVRREMAVFVNNCTNNPPVIDAPTDTCVVAGAKIKLNFKSWDPDKNDSLYLNWNDANLGLNGPFSSTISNPATLTITAPIPPAPANKLPVGLRNNNKVDTLKGHIIWDTDCRNIRKNPYQIDLRAFDNIQYRTAAIPRQLTANHVMTIRVVAPPVTGLTADKSPRQIKLHWNPSSCNTAIGYRVYRKAGQASIPKDDCCSLKPLQAGFTELITTTGLNDTSFIDSLKTIGSLENAKVCYVVTAIFGADQSESCPSEVVCIELKNDNLYMTTDSVGIDGTDAAVGKVRVAWSQPKFVDAFFPGPFTYTLYRANNTQSPVFKVKENIPFNDTVLMDSGFDTKVRGYNYRVELFDGEGLPVFTGGKFNTSSTIFLSTSSGNGNIILLTWRQTVSWKNTDYEVWRSENGSPYVPIATVTDNGTGTHTYQDTIQDKNKQYCYFIRSTGSHNVATVKSPLINDSNTACAFADDQTKPCAPTLSASGNCVTQQHTVVIRKPAATETCDDDVQFITVLFSQSSAGPFVPIKQLPYASLAAVDSVIFKFGVELATYAGYYAITATDSAGNVSTALAVDSVDYCPTFGVGNVFTPNGDGNNDFFIPLNYQDVLLKQFDVYDRWGRLIFRSTGSTLPILWDGNTPDGKPSSEGVYFYYIRYEERSLKGNRIKEARGDLSLFR